MSTKEYKKNFIDLYKVSQKASNKLKKPFGGDQMISEPLSEEAEPEPKTHSRSLSDEFFGFMM